MSTIDKTSPFPALNFPSEEEMRERSRARREVALAPFRDAASGAFIGVSLGAWLEHARSAGVPYIPAVELARIDRETFLRSEQTIDTHRSVWEQFFGALRATPAGHMVRWDACAGLDLKTAMARGEAFGDHALQLHPDDPRAFDILYEYPADELRVWARPWMDAM